MAEAYSRDRLQPALLERLIDERPGERVEPPEARTITRQRLRQSVLQDLKRLFNATATLDDEPGTERFEHARNSALNFGIRSLSGMLASKLDLADLERMLHRAILRFEPRILPDTLRVRGAPPADPLSRHNVLEFEISGRLWAQPYPLELLLKTDLDLETGQVEIRERSTIAADAQRASPP